MSDLDSIKRDLMSAEDFGDLRDACLLMADAVVPEPVARSHQDSPCKLECSGQHRYGLSMRDWFAGKVLGGFAANPAIFSSFPRFGWINCDLPALTAYAYEIADEMLKSRKTTP